MASLIVAPNPARVGDPLTIIGEGFTAATPVALRLPSEGFSSELTSDAGGHISSDDIGDHADGTLTAAGNPANNETVTLGSRVYTFKTTLTGAANEVLIGAAATNTLDNLKAAVNAGAGAGTLYGTGTVVHADILAGTKTATTIFFYARLAGTAGNSLATTETAATALSFGAATLLGGLGDPSGSKSMDWVPTRPGTYTITASDGTNTATTTLQVFQSG